MATKKTTKKSSTTVPASQPVTLPAPATAQQEAFDLNMETYKLLCAEPFFAGISRYVTKIASKAIPTAGVTVDPKTANFVMYYNPDFFATLTPVQKLAVLKHEYYHLVLEHVTGRKPTAVNDAKCWNFATDLAINSFLLNELPEFCLLPGKGMFKDYPTHQAAEWYFKKLKQDKQFQQPQQGEGEGQGGGQGDQQFDSHEKWQEGAGKPGEENGQGGADGTLAGERLKEIMRKAAQEAVNAGNNWGSISADMRKDILARLTSKLDWRKVLRYFIKTSQRADKTGTIRKINKRYAYIHPGRKVNRHAKIAISIDQSGSVSDQMLVAFFSELNALADIAEFTVIPFDHEVAESKIYTWKKGQHHKAERVLCGGTDFDAPTAYVNKHSNFDGHIILTDLCAPKPRPSKVQRMWITTEDCAAHPYFQTNERIIAIPLKGNE